MNSPFEYLLCKLTNNNGVTQHVPFIFTRVTRLPLVRDMFRDRILIKAEWSVSVPCNLETSRSLQTACHAVCRLREGRFNELHARVCFGEIT